MFLRLSLLLAAAFAFGATAGPAAAETLAASAIPISGGEQKRLRVCEQRRFGVTLTRLGAKVIARNPDRGRLVLSRCAAGRFKALRASRAKRLRVPTGRRATGDYRLQLKGGGRVHGTTFLRVGAGEIVDVPVAFEVVNQNRTSLGCPAPGPDGGDYRVRGTLVAPRALLDAGNPSAALYYHGLSYASFFFRFGDVPGYDYGLEQARDGHASVVVDRLGYGRSEGPDGAAICYASQADVADQIIAALRSGEYAARGATAFKRVALVGHSGGGFIANIAQYEFATADALGLLSFADSGFSGEAGAAFTAAQTKCSTDPDRSRGEVGQPNYAFVGETDEDFSMLHLFDTDPRVAEATLPQRTRDPCGDLGSVPGAIVADQEGNGKITSPVLVLIGAEDAIFPPPAGEQQAMRYTGSDDVDYVELPGTGHALTLGRTHEAFRLAMDRWLDDHGF